MFSGALLDWKEHIHAPARTSDNDCPRGSLVLLASHNQCCLLEFSEEMVGPLLLLTNRSFYPMLLNGMMWVCTAVLRGREEVECGVA